MEPFPGKPLQPDKKTRRAILERTIRRPAPRSGAGNPDAGHATSRRSFELKKQPIDRAVRRDAVCCAFRIAWDAGEEFPANQSRSEIVGTVIAENWILALGFFVGFHCSLEDNGIGRANPVPFPWAVEIWGIGVDREDRPNKRHGEDRERANDFGG